MRAYGDADGRCENADGKKNMVKWSNYYQNNSNNNNNLILIIIIIIIITITRKYEIYLKF